MPSHVWHILTLNDKWKEEESIFKKAHKGLFSITKWWPMQKKRDDIMTWPTFYTIFWKDSECPLPVSAFIQTTGSEALVDQK